MSAHCRVPARDWLERMVASFDREEIAGVYSSQSAFPDAPFFEHLFRWYLYQRQVSLPGWPSFSFNNSASMIRRDLLVRRPFDPDMIACEDFDWALWAFRNGYEVVQANGANVLHSHQEPLARFLVRRTKEALALTRILLAGWRSYFT